MRRALLVGLLPLLLITACGSGPSNTDPRKGYVQIGSGTNDKYCDGTTLVYEVGEGGSAVPDSPECRS